MMQGNNQDSFFRKLRADVINQSVNHGASRQSVEQLLSSQGFPFNSPELIAEATRSGYVNQLKI